MIAALRLLRPHLRAHRGRILVALAAMLGEVVAAALAPVPLQRIIDSVVRPGLRAGGGALDAGSIALLAALVVAAALIAVLDAVVTYVDLRCSASVAVHAATDLKRSLFAHLQRLSLSFHHGSETRSGDLLVRLGSDVQTIQDVTTVVPASLLTNGGAALLMVLLLFRVDTLVGLVVALTAIPMFAVVRHYHRRLKDATRVARRQEGRVAAIVSESLGAVKLVKAFGREREESGRLRAATDDGMRYGLAAAEHQARFQPAVELVTAVCVAAVLLLGAVLALRRVITVGELTLVVAYSRGVFGSLRQLAKVGSQTARAGAAADRIAGLLAQAPAIVDPPAPVAFPRQRPLEVSFRGVTAGYTPGRPALDAIDVAVPAGSTLAVVGPAGAGKSTLLSLVPRFYDVWSGAVEVGGVDVRDLAGDELRENIALVLQETLLNRDTVWDNIAYGRSGAGDAEVLAAAEAAGVTRFVDTLENGFDTVVSERGTSLSGGQRQCIAIARAMIRDAPIVLLDEPTSNLDAITERLVVEAIRRLVAGRTAIVVAHSLRTVEHADLVAVLERGRVVQLGPPARLAQVPGLFGELSRLHRVTG